ncbi:YopT-type cysteine protease domain-containing protein [Microbulbifer sp. JMSA003]|uniref:YopT-type cysteine protease domain-containing protein n=1 Tax=Microbulbifer sp. JMSA003 TaxID=3243369 RepID=UPI004039038C
MTGRGCALKLARKFQGRLAWDFDQGLPVLGVKKEFSACVCLSAHWVKYRSDGKHLHHRLGGYFDKGEYISFNDNFYSYITHLDVHSQLGPSSWDHYLQLLGLNNLHLEWKGGELGTLPETISTANSCCAIIVFYSKKDKSTPHTASAWLSGDDGLFFFDPNIGELQFGSGDKFSTFLHLLISTIYNTDVEYDSWKICWVRNR